MPTGNPHLEKLLEYCALAPNIEKYCERQRKFEEKHPIIAQTGSSLPLLGGMLTIAVLSYFGYLEFPVLMASLIGLMGVNVGAMLVWNALEKRKTHKKLGYSFGIFLDENTSPEQTQTILKKLLRLPATPQTQELKTQLWELASKNLLPMSWWNDVEREIDAWVASHERDVLKAKLLEPDVLETISTVGVEPSVLTQKPSTHRVEL